MADTPLTKRKETGADIMRRVNRGYNSPGRNGTIGNPMGAIMGFMGAPNLAGGPQRRGQYGGMQGIMNNFYGAGGGGNKPGTGGNDPAVDPNDPDAEMKKVGLPSWWIDWLHTNGQYGVWNKPPGLLG